MSLSKDKVYLMGGIGNRLNVILNHVDRLDKITFVWANHRECGSPWEELFDFPKLNVIFKDPIPYDSKGIQSHGNFKSTFLMNSLTRKHAPRLLKYLYMDHLLQFSTDPNFIYECVRARNHFIYQHNKLKLKAAQQFIKSLVPSKQVAKLMPNIPEGTDGYAIRLLHPNSMVKKPIKVPKGSFISTDSEEQLRFSRGQTIQTPGIGGTYDKDPNTQDKQGSIRAVADWFSLFKCKKIFEVGLPFKSLADDPYKGHSTFIDCHRILGYNIENYANNNCSFTKK